MDFLDNVMRSIKVIDNFTKYIESLDLTLEELGLINIYFSKIEEGIGNTCLQLRNIKLHIDYSIDLLTEDHSISDENFDKIAKVLLKLSDMVPSDLYLSNLDEKFWYKKE